MFFSVWWLALLVSNKVFFQNRTCYFKIYTYTYIQDVHIPSYKYMYMHANIYTCLFEIKSYKKRKKIKRERGREKESF